MLSPCSQAVFWIPVAFCQKLCYAGVRKEISFSAASNGRRLAPLIPEGASCPLREERRGCPVVTYTDMFTYSLVIIGICSLFIQAKNKK